MKAFSLIETIAVMLLTAFLLLLAWKGVQYVQQQTLWEERYMARSEEEMLFRYRLQKDFHTGMRFLSRHTAAFSLYHPYLGDTVFYGIQTDYVLRKEKKRIDTFKIKVKELHLDAVSCQLRIGEQSNLQYFHILPYSSCD